MTSSIANVVRVTSSASSGLSMSVSVLFSFWITSLIEPLELVSAPGTAPASLSGSILGGIVGLLGSVALLFEVSSLPVSSATRALILATRESIAVIVSVFIF